MVILILAIAPICSAHRGVTLVLEGRVTKQETKQGVVLQPYYFDHYWATAFFFCEPFLRGEDYPVLVEIWVNEDDEIYDYAGRD